MIQGGCACQKLGDATRHYPSSYILWEPFVCVFVWCTEFTKYVFIVCHTRSSALLIQFSQPCEVDLTSFYFPILQMGKLAQMKWQSWKLESRSF